MRRRLASGIVIGSAVGAACFTKPDAPSAVADASLDDASGDGATPGSDAAVVCAMKDDYSNTQLVPACGPWAQQLPSDTITLTRAAGMLNVSFEGGSGAIACETIDSIALANLPSLQIADPPRGFGARISFEVETGTGQRGGVQIQGNGTTNQPTWLLVGPTGAMIGPSNYVVAAMGYVRLVPAGSNALGLQMGSNGISYGSTIGSVGFSSDLTTVNVRITFQQLTDGSASLANVDNFDACP